MSQNPPFEFSEDELEQSIDAFRYTSAPKAHSDRRRSKAARRSRGVSDQVTHEGASSQSESHQDTNTSGR